MSPESAAPRLRRREYGFTNLSFENLTRLEFLRDDPNR
jgi:hypothetical protein